MRAIALYQPWASLWLTDSKIHETRSWPLPRKGELAVHASKKIQQDLEEPTRLIVERRFGHDWMHTLPTGAIIGAVEIIDCLKTEEVYPNPLSRDAPDDYWCGNFAPGRFAWRRGRAFTLPTPRPFTGRQNIFQVDDAIFPRLNWRTK